MAGLGAGRKGQGCTGRRAVRRDRTDGGWFDRRGTARAGGAVRGPGRLDNRRPFADLLTPERALIFRITHRANLGWLLRNGLHCAASGRHDPAFVAIGNPDLIDKRRTRRVDVPPGGVLSDYVPFYFTPSSPMLLNIRTGWGGAAKRPDTEVVILISSLGRLQDAGVGFVFSDRHAYLQSATFHTDVADLRRLDWDGLQRRDFRRDPNDPARFERYQAEALAHGHVPVEALMGVACADESSAKEVEGVVEETAPGIRVVVRPGWYFR